MSACRRVRVFCCCCLAMSRARGPSSTRSGCGTPSTRSSTTRLLTTVRSQTACRFTGMVEFQAVRAGAAGVWVLLSRVLVVVLHAHVLCDRRPRLECRLPAHHGLGVAILC